ncbi:hypothetical protein CMQ_7525 [Grosmannia clavigera kw1407]|uniref:HTH CENPB-type domain-containing protein n=1 Tax=Grosmannia clavigera (strain kw1407 / UAMH 11150) TaxID=655863 RepID=F0XPT3_GROCL|nr:uncharacterized protein CMQ_7525 [Grosmannia clavigera kw1407]EFX00523.1 hypothetical protein CMQ_7525 [Grosmannia clavigera kw1407]
MSDHQNHHQQEVPIIAQPVPHHHHLPQLPMLMVPSNPTWPSMLTNPGGNYPSTAPSTISSASHGRQSIGIPVRRAMKPNEKEGKPTPRRMLTDDDRRRMCKYADMNPGVKQSDIGNLFGVERSTVSKVLRNKEKYFNKEDRSKSPHKKAKGKLPDIERALSNWVRNAQKTGTPMTDDAIQEKFRFFATSTGNPDTVLKASSSSWLEKFKQKNGIGAGRLLRRASETNIPDRRLDAAVARAIESPSLTPPSPSPLSASRSDDEREAVSTGAAAGNYLGFSQDSSPNTGHAGHSGMGLGSGLTMGLGMAVGSYKHGNNQSTTSLSSVFTETPVSSFSGGAMSPTMSFTFSPDSNVGSFLPHDSMGPPGSSNFQRPRSQTLPALNLDYLNQPQNDTHSQNIHDASAVSMPESMTPKYHLHHVPSSAPSSAVESPMTEMSATSYGIESNVVSPQLRRSSSSNSLMMAIPRSAGGIGGSTMGSHMSGGSSPSSPTQEDAQRAAETLLSFIQSVPSNFDNNDYMALLRLSEKLRSHHHQQHIAKATAAAQGMGGLTRIPEGDVEMASDLSHSKLGTTMTA